jgi:dihydropteroate synthase
MAPVSARWTARLFDLDLSGRTKVMGVLNVTPDSFSDGGRFATTEAAVAHALRMVEEGADLLDVGGESTRPGAATVPAEEELARVLPVIERLRSEAPNTPLSIDTRKAEVAEAAVEAGAVVVNDVSGGSSDPRMFDLVARTGAAFVLMHMRGDPGTMQQLTGYDDVVGEVRSWLAGRVEEAVSAGIPLDAIAVDPGLGFAKTAEQSLRLMRDIAALHAVGRPLVVGASRKSFVGKVLGTEVNDRVEGTAASVAWLASNGVQIVRVHDVRAMVRVVTMIEAIRSAP